MDNTYILETMQTNMINTRIDYSEMNIINLCEDLIQHYGNGGGLNAL